MKEDLIFEIGNSESVHDGAFALELAAMTIDDPVEIERFYRIFRSSFYGPIDFVRKAVEGIKGETMKLNFKEWDGKALKGKWLFTYKLDGIQARVIDGKIVSKSGKPLYNLPGITEKFQVAEIFCGSWGETWSIVSASKSKRREVLHDEIYTILPIDPRLLIMTFTLAPRDMVKNGHIGIRNTPFMDDPTEEDIKAAFQRAKELHYEGLVLHNAEDDIYVKVKDKQTIDVKVTGLIKSTAKSHYGLLKEFVTERGRVGTGITKEQRKEYCDEKLIGTIIEVECTELTKNGKFRHPRFVRLRPDKS